MMADLQCVACEISPDGWPHAPVFWVWFVSPAGDITREVYDAPEATARTEAAAGCGRPRRTNSATAAWTMSKSAASGHAGNAAIASSTGSRSAIGGRVFMIYSRPVAARE